MPFINKSIELEIEGPEEIIGPNKVALIGGCIAVWVKKGIIKLKVKSSRFNSDDVKIKVEK